jgi:hypothetical protein
MRLFRSILSRPWPRAKQGYLPANRAATQHHRDPPAAPSPIRVNARDRRCASMKGCRNKRASPIDFGTSSTHRTETRNRMRCRSPRQADTFNECCAMNVAPHAFARASSASLTSILRSSPGPVTRTGNSSRRVMASACRSKPSGSQPVQRQSAASAPSSFVA